METAGMIAAIVAGVCFIGVIVWTVLDEILNRDSGWGVLVDDPIANDLTQSVIDSYGRGDFDKTTGLYEWYEIPTDLLPDRDSGPGRPVQPNRMTVTTTQRDFDPTATFRLEVLDRLDQIVDLCRGNVVLDTAENQARHDDSSSVGGADVGPSAPDTPTVEETADAAPRDDSHADRVSPQDLNDSEYIAARVADGDLLHKQSVLQIRAAYKVTPAGELVRFDGSPIT